MSTYQGRGRGRSNTRGGRGRSFSGYSNAGGRGRGRSSSSGGSTNRSKSKKKEDKKYEFVPHTSESSTHYHTFKSVKEYIITKVSRTYGPHASDMVDLLETLKEIDLESKKPTIKEAKMPTIDEYNVDYGNAKSIEEAKTWLSIDTVTAKQKQENNNIVHMDEVRTWRNRSIVCEENKRKLFKLMVEHCSNAM